MNSKLVFAFTVLIIVLITLGALTYYFRAEIEEFFDKRFTKTSRESQIQQPSQPPKTPAEEEIAAITAATTASEHTPPSYIPPPIEYEYKPPEPDTKEWIMALAPREFEEYICDIFRDLGYLIIELTPETNDGGKDIIVERDNITYYVECKQWQETSYVSRPDLQKLVGAAALDGVTHVIFVSTCRLQAPWLKPRTAARLFMWNCGA